MTPIGLIPVQAILAGASPDRTHQAANGDRFRDTSDNYPRPALRVGLCACRQHVAPGTPAGERVAAGTSADNVGSCPLPVHLTDVCFHRRAATLHIDLHVAPPPEAHFQKAKIHSPAWQLLL